MTELEGAALYIDTGSDFNEREKIVIRFEKCGNVVSAVFHLEKKTMRIRFDPCDSGQPSFYFDRIILISGHKASAQARPYDADYPSNETRPRVLVNLTRLLPQDKGAGGAGRLAMALLTHLPKSTRLRVAVTTASQYLIDRFPEIDFIVVLSDNNACLAGGISWCQCYIDPMNGLRPINIDPRVAVISLVLDLQHMRMPWFFSTAELNQRISEYSYAIGRSDHLVAISSYEAENLVEYYGVDRVSVAHLAGFMAEDSSLTVDQIETRRRNAIETSPYLVYPAVPWLHKNHDMLIQAIAILTRRGIDIPLSMTNTKGNTAGRSRLSKIVMQLRVADLVKLEEFLSESELLCLFTACRGMIFPSLYEGFGIPLVDAMALGVPILTNKATAIEEICGEAVAYFENASNAITISDDIEAFWFDEIGRLALEKLGIARARQFSSAKMVESIRGAINAAIHLKQSEGFLLPPQSRFTLPRYHKLSVFIYYTGLDDAGIESLKGIQDINEFHGLLFGRTADVTVGIDISLVDDPILRALFRPAKQLICFDASTQNNLDDMVCDFSTRFDRAEFHFVTAFRANLSLIYNADLFTSALFALGIHNTADFAVFDETLQDVFADEKPDEREGVLAYERRRRVGLAVTDTVIRRSQSHDHKNGTVHFLSLFCTTYRKLRIPQVRL